MPVRLGPRDPEEATFKVSQQDPSTALGMTCYGGYIASTNRSDFSLGKTDCSIWFIT
jgi:hypothetical protein